METRYGGLHAADNAFPVKNNCKKCDTEHCLYTWQRFANRTVHIKARCLGCGGFIQWAKQRVDVNAPSFDESASSVVNRTSCCD